MWKLWSKESQIWHEKAKNFIRGASSEDLTPMNIENKSFKGEKAEELWRKFTQTSDEIALNHPNVRICSEGTYDGMVSYSCSVMFNSITLKL